MDDARERWRTSTERSDCTHKMIWFGSDSFVSFSHTEDRRDRRARALMMKRVCVRVPETAGDDDNDASPAAVVAVEEKTLRTTMGECIQQIRISKTRTERVRALRTVRRLLSIQTVEASAALVCDDDTSDSVNVLLSVLQLADAECQLEACCCVTNLASGEHTTTKRVLPAAPYLVQYLSSRDSFLQSQAVHPCQEGFDNLSKLMNAFFFLFVCFGRLGH